MKYSTKRCDIFKYYCYFCHVRIIPYRLFRSIKVDEFSGIVKYSQTFVYQTLALFVNNNATGLRCNKRNSYVK